MDMIRREVEDSLGTLRSMIKRLEEVQKYGPTPRWVDTNGRTATEEWATWALPAVRSAERAIIVLALPVRQSRLTADELVEVEQSKRRVAELRALFTAAGGHLLPADLPSL